MPLFEYSLEDSETSTARPDDSFPPSLQPSEAPCDVPTTTVRYLILAAKLLVTAVIISLIVLAHRHHEIALRWLAQGLRVREQLGPWYPIIFICIHAFAVACFVPSEVITICGGFMLTYDTVYGYVPGLCLALVYVMTSLFLVSSFHFILCRRVVKPRTIKYLPPGSIQRAVKDAIDEGGFQAACLLRLIPIMPFALGSGLLGLTDLPYATATASVIGAMPLSLFFCWIGADSDGLDSIFDGQGGQHTTSRLCLSLATVIIILFTVWYFRKTVRRRLNEPLQTSQGSLIGESELPLLLPNGLVLSS